MNLRRLPLALVLLFSVVAASVALPGCASKGSRKSASHLYSGDAPNIRMSDEPETAGGRMHTR